MQDFAIKIFHFITALENAGAEKILYTTISGLSKYNHEVIVLKKSGAYVSRLENDGIKVHTFGLRMLVKFLFGSRNSVIVHCYLYHTHILSFLLWLFRYKIIWALHSALPPTRYIHKKVISILSYIVPIKIIYVSKYSREIHQSIGFSSSESKVIYNGINVERYSGSTCTDTQLLNSFTGLKICMVARYHQVKNFDKFFTVASKLVSIHDNVRFYLIGKGNVESNHELVQHIRSYNLQDKTVLLGEVPDMYRIYPCFNLLVSTSRSESFGLTILESIMSGISASSLSLPVIDELLGENSTNENNQSDDQLALQWLYKSSIKPDDSISRMIKDKYSLHSMIHSYCALYEELSDEI